MNELKKVDDEVFLDRDGKTFETLVNYLRNDRKVFPEFQTKQEENLFFKELHYWGIDKEHLKWQEDYLRTLNKVGSNAKPTQSLLGMRNSMVNERNSAMTKVVTRSKSPLPVTAKKYFDPKEYTVEEINIT